MGRWLEGRRRAVKIHSSEGAPGLAMSSWCIMRRLRFRLLPRRRKRLVAPVRVLVGRSLSVRPARQWLSATAETPTPQYRLFA